MDFIVNIFHQGTSVIIPFIVLLGVLIFVHELGHFSVAKFFGVRVEVFSLGFGRKILKRKWGDTTYAISLIPFGGYVKMFGDDMSTDIPPDQRKYSFNHQPVLPRIAVVLAGPFMNALFAALLFVTIAGVGEEVLRSHVGDVYAGTPAYDDGFRTDDLITRVDGKSVDKWDDVKKLIEDNPGKNMTFTVTRNGSSAEIHGTPELVTNKNVLSSKPQVGDIEGLNYLTRASTIGITDPTSPAAVAGLATGDTIRKVDSVEINRWDELEERLTKAAQSGAQLVKLDVERGNGPSTLSVTLPLNPQAPLAGMEPSELYLSSIVPKSAAADAGLQAGDRLISINGKKLEHWEDVVKMVQGYKPSEGPLKIEFRRGTHDLSASIVPRLMTQTDSSGVSQKNYALGIVTGLAYSTPETFIAKESGLAAMLTKGSQEFYHWTKLTALSFVKLAQGKVSSKSIGGPLMIGKLASDTWRIGVSPFLKIMAIISINLFLLNLLPIPVLDGGHLLFFSIEFVKGSPLSFRKIEIMQQVGMLLLLALMVFSMFNDIVRFFSS